MIDGDGLVQVREIAQMLGITLAAIHGYRRRGVFTAIKLPTRIWAIHQTDLAEVMTRIDRYRFKQPFHPEWNMTIADACAELGVEPVSIYAMLKTGALERGYDELRTMPSRDSVRRMRQRRGLRSATA